MKKEVISIIASPLDLTGGGAICYNETMTNRDFTFTVTVTVRDSCVSDRANDREIASYLAKNILVWEEFEDDAFREFENVIVKNESVRVEWAEAVGEIKD